MVRHFPPIKEKKGGEGCDLQRPGFPRPAAPKSAENVPCLDFCALRTDHEQRPIPAIRPASSSDLRGTLAADERGEAMTRLTGRDRLVMDLSRLDHEIGRAKRDATAAYDRLQGLVRTTLATLGQEVRPENRRAAIEAQIAARCAAQGYPVTADGYVGTKGAAFVLGQRESTLRDWRARGAPLSFRRLHTGAIQYSLEALAAYLAACDEMGDG